MDVIACVLVVVIGYLVMFFAGYETVRAPIYAIAIMGYFILKKIDNIAKELKLNEKENKND